MVWKLHFDKDLGEVTDYKLPMSQQYDTAAQRTSTILGCIIKENITEYWQVKKGSKEGNVDGTRDMRAYSIRIANGTWAIQSETKKD